MFEVRLYASAAGRSQATEFLDSLPARDRAQIAADIAALRDHGLQAPISMKPIKGRPNRGIFEIRTGGFRTFFCQRGRGDLDPPCLQEAGPGRGHRGGPGTYAEAVR